MNHFIPQYVRSVRMRDGKMEYEIVTQFIEWISHDVPDGPYPMLREKSEWTKLGESAVEPENSN